MKANPLFNALTCNVFVAAKDLCICIHEIDHKKINYVIVQLSESTHLM